jgi:hypothetical protein
MMCAASTKNWHFSGPRLGPSLPAATAGQSRPTAARIEKRAEKPHLFPIR